MKLYKKYKLFIQVTILSLIYVLLVKLLPYEATNNYFFILTPFYIALVFNMLYRSIKRRRKQVLREVETLEVTKKRITLEETPLQD